MALALTCDGTTGSAYSEASFALTNSYPLSLSIWFNPTAVAGQQYFPLFLRDDSGGNNYAVGIQMRLNLAGDPCEAIHYHYGGTGNLSALSSTSVVANTWQHAGAVFVDNGGGEIEARVYLDGAGKVTATSTTINAMSGNDTVSVGRRASGAAGHCDADVELAEAAAFQAELTDGEMASLAAGACPLLVRPDSLIMYLPLGGVYGN